LTDGQVSGGEGVNDAVLGAFDVHFEQVDLGVPELAHDGGQGFDGHVKGFRPAELVWHGRGGEVLKVGGLEDLQHSVIRTEAEGMNVEAGRELLTLEPGEALGVGSKAWMGTAVYAVRRRSKLIFSPMPKL